MRMCWGEHVISLAQTLTLAVTYSSVKDLEPITAPRWHFPNMEILTLLWQKPHVLSLHAYPSQPGTSTQTWGPVWKHPPITFLGQIQIQHLLQTMLVVYWGMYTSVDWGVMWFPRHTLPFQGGHCGSFLLKGNCSRANYHYSTWDSVYVFEDLWYWLGDIRRRLLLRRVTCLLMELKAFEASTRSAHSVFGWWRKVHFECTATSPPSWPAQPCKGPATSSTSQPTMHRTVILVRTSPIPIDLTPWHLSKGISQQATKAVRPSEST